MSAKLEVFEQLIPAYCPNCGELYAKTDVKAVTLAEQPYYKAFCGYCGAIYDKIRPEY